MEGIHGGLSGGAASPTGSVRPGTGGSYKRKRSGVEFESSPGTGGEGEEDEQDRRRQPGVKRACNECRQQKVSQSMFGTRKMKCQCNSQQTWYTAIERLELTLSS